MVERTPWKAFSCPRSPKAPAEETGPLTREQQSVLEEAEDAGEALGLPAIGLWEIAKLVERRRLELRSSVDALFQDIEASPRLQILPLTPRIALESTRLGAGFHKDPADQLIVATARVHGLTLVTSDDSIRRSGSVSVI